MAPKRLLLAAGGTGGHMFPAQALSEEMKRQGWETALITDVRGAKLTQNFPHDEMLTISAATISPRRPIKAVKGIITILKGYAQSRKFINEWRPDVVAGFGGYPAFPALKAAQTLKRPYILHEQNAVLGRVNRALVKDAKFLATGFLNTERNNYPKKTHFVGNPVRTQIIEAVPENYTLSDPINIFIVGGSLGARLISQTIPQAIALLPEELRKRLNIVQQTRQEYIDEAKSVYEAAGVRAQCESFFHAIETQLREADYIISRAGALSVSEIALMGKPSLFVPLAIAMDDHQRANAGTLKDLNAADILPESEFTPERVASILVKRINDSQWLHSAHKAAQTAAKPDAAAHLARLVSSLA